MGGGADVVNDIRILGNKNFEPMGFTIEFQLERFKSSLELSNPDQTQNPAFIPAAQAFAQTFIDQLCKTEEFKGAKLSSRIEDNGKVIVACTHGSANKADLAEITLGSQDKTLVMKFYSGYVTNDSFLFSRIHANTNQSSGVDLNQLFRDLTRIKVKDSMDRPFLFNHVVIVFN